MATGRPKSSFKPRMARSTAWTGRERISGKQISRLERLNQRILCILRLRTRALRQTHTKFFCRWPAFEPIIGFSMASKEDILLEEEFAQKRMSAGIFWRLASYLK